MVVPRAEVAEDPSQWIGGQVVRVDEQQKGNYFISLDADHSSEISFGHSVIREAYAVKLYNVAKVPAQSGVAYEFLRVRRSSDEQRRSAATSRGPLSRVAESKENSKKGQEAEETKEGSHSDKRRLSEDTLERCDVHRVIKAEKSILIAAGGGSLFQIIEAEHRRIYKEHLEQLYKNEVALFESDPSTGYVGWEVVKRATAIPKFSLCREISAQIDDILVLGDRPFQQLPSSVWLWENIPIPPLSLTFEKGNVVVESGFASVFKVTDVRQKHFALKVFNKWPSGMISTYEKCAGFDRNGFPLDWSGVRLSSKTGTEPIDLRSNWATKGRQKVAKEWLQEV